MKSNYKIIVFAANYDRQTGRSRKGAYNVFRSVEFPLMIGKSLVNIRNLIRLFPPGFIAISLIIFLLQFAVVHAAENYSFADLLRALHHVESGGRAAPPDGDSGRAIGPYQIWQVYWQDAAEFSKIHGGYQDCRNKEYSEKIVLAYFERYAPGATKVRLVENLKNKNDKILNLQDCEILARIHNGGPAGYKKIATLKYWNKILQALKNFTK